MPNRIIKESVCTSDTINEMTWFEECFYTRLWTACDDYGRMDARPAILKAKLFPLKERLSLKDIERALERLADIGCVRLYECDSKPYLYLPAWEAHQQIRSKKSKFPDPDLTCIQTKSHDIICNQMISDDSICPRNPIQSESESEYESNFMPGAETPDSSSQNNNCFISLQLNDKSFFDVTEDMINRWAELYPAADIRQELRKMNGWLDSNPTRRKTRSGIKRFITNWLAKAQDSAKNPVKSGLYKEPDRVDYLDEYKKFINPFGR